MDETKLMAMQIRVYTAILMVVCAILSLLLWPDGFKSIAGGIVIGAFTGLMGFNMICNMVRHIDGDSMDIKAGAYRSYLRRYLLYALIFSISVSQGVSILALLVGVFTHKIAIFIYTIKNRKEDESGHF